RSAAARGQITFAFRVQAPLQAKNICPSRRPADLRFSSRFVSFSFQGTIALLGCKEFHFLINSLSLASSFFILT
ncbi:hypothetical protein P4519_10515, partial [Geobacillus stearothermophilus]|nr:hypothetical protein [Geobacillus stearothermophilus]MED3775359.1 hypothetical protein [Geobacillus stearothermophilus]